MADTKKKAAVKKYIGARYKDGLILPNGVKIRPAHWAQNKIDTMLKRYPQAAKYFTAE